MSRRYESDPIERPELRLDHLLRMTDVTGLLQHATYTVPNYQEGYCVDDNARALLLTRRLELMGRDGPELRALTTTYCAFLQAAFNRPRGRFRNFMGYDRRWLEEEGSDDSHGRALWALGTTVARSSDPDLVLWAAEHFDYALPAILETTSPRAWAFAILGSQEYLHHFHAHQATTNVAANLVARLMDLYDRVNVSDWAWFEESATYDNARLPQALIHYGRDRGDLRVLEAGLRSLEWLVAVQRTPSGVFRPIGSEGFYRKGETPAVFAQQPLEADATVSACLEAYRATDDERWRDEARIAFEWFLGRNDLGVPLYDEASGGCRDGLEAERVSRNQGAESTLAFLLSLAEMNLSESSLALFGRAR